MHVLTQSLKNLVFYNFMICILNTTSLSVELVSNNFPFFINTLNTDIVNSFSPYSFKKEFKAFICSCVGAARKVSPDWVAENNDMSFFQLFQYCLGLRLGTFGNFPSAAAT